MNTIAKKQNEKTTIEYLAAARRLYSMAKCLRGIKVFLGVIIIAFLAYLQLRYPENENVSYALVMVSVLALIAEPVLDCRISAYKVQGAKMQQCFDNDLFGFSWNESVCGKRPTEDKVVDYCKGKPIKKKLYDWYKGIEADMDEDLAVLLCQNQSGSYDRRLRGRLVVEFYDEQEHICTDAIELSPNGSVVALNIRLASGILFGLLNPAL